MSLLLPLNGLLASINNFVRVMNTYSGLCMLAKKLNHISGKHMKH